MKEKYLRIISAQGSASMEARWFRGVDQWQLTLEAARTAEAAQCG